MFNNVYQFSRIMLAYRGVCYVVSNSQHDKNFDGRNGRLMEPWLVGGLEHFLSFHILSGKLT